MFATPPRHNAQPFRRHTQASFFTPGPLTPPEREVDMTPFPGKLDFNLPAFTDPFATTRLGMPIICPPSPSSSDEDEDEDEGIKTPASISRLPSATARPSSLFASEQPRRPSHRPTVLVVGVGYVGRHLVERFSDACEVVGLDLSEDRCTRLRGEFEADGLSNITMISNIEQDERCNTFDLALISVPTLLLADNKTVDTRHIRAAVETVSQRARPGSTVVIESSVTVGMTRALLGPEGANLRARGIFVGFSPERVDPGRVLPLFEDIPKVVSGIDDASLAAITRLYSRSFNSVVPVRSLETAEFCKLYENCQRLMLITYVNEMADACEQHGVDIHDVCAASATKPFGFTPFNPSLGAGGHCIPVNCWYLLNNCDIPVLRAAAVSNKQRPVHKAKQVAAIAHERNVEAAGHPPSVLIYGMGFKAGEASLAYAPTVTLARELESQGCRVTYFDDYVQSDEWASLPRDAFNTYRIDALFDVVVVAQKPSSNDRRVLDELSCAQVVSFVQ